MSKVCVLGILMVAVLRAQSQPQTVREIESLESLKDALGGTEDVAGQRPLQFPASGVFTSLR